MYKIKPHQSNLELKISCVIEICAPIKYSPSSEVLRGIKSLAPCLIDYTLISDKVEKSSGIQ